MRFDLPRAFRSSRRRRCISRRSPTSCCGSCAATRTSAGSRSTASRSGTNGLTRTATSAPSTVSSGAAGRRRTAATSTRSPRSSGCCATTRTRGGSSSAPGTSPTSRGWRLPPCHALFQFHVGAAPGSSGRLSCQLYQRSADVFLGVPFNIASYALLTHMLAQQRDLEPGDLVWTGGDCHIYDNHREQIETQLAREPHPYPTLRLRRRPASIFDYTFEDFEVVGYEHHPAIRAPVGGVRITLVAAIARGGVIGGTAPDPLAHPGGPRVLPRPHDGPSGRDGAADVGLASRALPAAAGPAQHRRHAEPNWTADGAERARVARRGAATRRRCRGSLRDRRRRDLRRSTAQRRQLVLTEIDLDVVGRHDLPGLGSRGVRGGHARAGSGGRWHGALLRHATSAAGGVSRLLVGTSGWGYPSWQPGFYPAGLDRSEFLTFYAAQLATVELNATKYRLPSEEQFRVLGLAGPGRIPVRGQGPGPGRAPARDVRGARALSRRSPRLRPGRGRASAGTTGSSSSSSARWTRRSATRSTCATRAGTASSSCSPRPGWCESTTEPVLPGGRTCASASSSIRTWSSELSRRARGAGEDRYGRIAFFRHGDEPDAPRAALRVSGGRRE